MDSDEEYPTTSLEMREFQERELQITNFIFPNY